MSWPSPCPSHFHRSAAAEGEDLDRRLDLPALLHRQAGTARLPRSRRCRRGPLSPGTPGLVVGGVRPENPGTDESLDRTVPGECANGPHERGVSSGQRTSQVLAPLIQVTRTRQGADVLTLHRESGPLPGRIAIRRILLVSHLITHVHRPARLNRTIVLSDAAGGLFLSVRVRTAPRPPGVDLTSHSCAPQGPGGQPASTSLDFRDALELLGGEAAGAWDVRAASPVGS